MSLAFRERSPLREDVPESALVVILVVLESNMAHEIVMLCKNLLIYPIGFSSFLQKPRFFVMVLCLGVIYRQSFIIHLFGHLSQCFTLIRNAKVVLPKFDARHKDHRLLMIHVV